MAHIYRVLFVDCLAAQPGAVVRTTTDKFTTWGSAVDFTYAVAAQKPPY